MSLNVRGFSRHLAACAVSGAAALALTAFGCLWVLERLADLSRDASPIAVSALASIPTAAPSRPFDRHAVSPPAPRAAAGAYAGMFEPGFFAGPATFSSTEPPVVAQGLEPAPAAVSIASAALADAAPSAPELAETAPAPPARPSEIAMSASPPPVVRVLALNAKGAPPAAPPPDSRTLEKLFGGAKTSGPALGYASAEDGLFSAGLAGVSGPSARYDRWTAVYDLSAHTVYLPDGTRLEAHSGLGDRLDDPNHVNERNRGATPPHVYQLASLDQPFHGVHALRLNPIGDGGIFGRDGLLAHTYMLGPRGDSNGCVVFRNYNAFLQAFQTGQVKRLVVVARLG